MDEADRDVPSPIDLRTETDAKAWAESAEVDRPWRSRLRSTFATELGGLPSGSRVLELGSGPGFLAERVLEACTNIERYTLLDFSEPMLDMARKRLARFDAADFVQRDFKSSEWTRGLGTYRAVITMQAIHELRHKRHAPDLYRQVHRLLEPRGIFLVCDHTPKDSSLRWTSLYMTAREQLEALASAGFTRVEMIQEIERLILVRGIR